MKDHDLTIETIGELITAQLGRKLPEGTVFTAESDFEELGLSSIDFTEIFVAIEERLGFDLDPAEAADVKTIGELLEVVNRLVAARGAES